MATYPHSFIKFTFGGSIANGQDEWNCGINLGSANLDKTPTPGFINSESYDAYIDTIAPLIKSYLIMYWTAEALTTPNGAKLDYAKFALINTNGEYEKEPTIVEMGGEPGSITATSYIPQITQVMTLQSDRWRDPGKYNRFYLPVANPVQANTFKIPGTKARAKATATFLQNIRKTVSAGGGEGTILPCAVTSSSNAAEGYLPISTVKVGDVFDTQKRRRNKLVETYNSEAVNFNAEP